MIFQHEKFSFSILRLRTLELKWHDRICFTRFKQIENYLRTLSQEVHKLFNCNIFCNFAFASLLNIPFGMFLCQLFLSKLKSQVHAKLFKRTLSPLNIHTHAQCHTSTSEIVFIFWILIVLSLRYRIYKIRWIWGWNFIKKNSWDVALETHSHSHAAKCRSISDAPNCAFNKKLLVRCHESLKMKWDSCSENFTYSTPID